MTPRSTVPRARLDDFHAPGDVPDAAMIVRGGQGEMPAAGTAFSGSQVATTAEAGRGVPHGQVRESTAGNIRAGAGMVEVKPERSRSGTMNTQPIPILEYRDFYDVPRAFIIAPQPQMFLLFDCAFDEDRDDYGDLFKVAVLRSAERAGLPEDWRKLDVLANIGSIPISAVHFDDSRRREVVIDGMQDLMATAERVSGWTQTVESEKFAGLHR